MEFRCTGVRPLDLIFGDPPRFAPWLFSSFSSFSTNLLPPIPYNGYVKGRRRRYTHPSRSHGWHDLVRISISISISDTMVPLGYWLSLKPNSSSLYPTAVLYEPTSQPWPCSFSPSALWGHSTQTSKIYPQQDWLPDVSSKENKGMPCLTWSVDGNG